jgi:membrane protein CcdC involved in cytochrome C biogenesis
VEILMSLLTIRAVLAVWDGGSLLVQRFLRIAIAVGCIFSSWLCDNTRFNCVVHVIFEK